jgi:hypothetical protein
MHTAETRHPEAKNAAAEHGSLDLHRSPMVAAIHKSLEFCDLVTNVRLEKFRPDLNERGGAE